MNENYIEAENLFNDGLLGESLTVLSGILKESPSNVECLMLRAKVFYRMQKWGDSINDLNKILEFDPDNTVAKNYKLMVLNIISFWNKDSYNP